MKAGTHRVPAFSMQARTQPAEKIKAQNTKKSAKQIVIVRRAMSSMPQMMDVKVCVQGLKILIRHCKVVVVKKDFIKSMTSTIILQTSTMIL